MKDRGAYRGRARDWLLLVLGSVFATLSAIVLGGVAAGGMLETALQVGLENRAIPVGIASAVLALVLGVVYTLLPADRGRRDS